MVPLLLIALISTRGNSGLFPEASLGAYESAVEAGADYLECDLQWSRDLVPVCLHDYYLARITDVAEKPGMAVVLVCSDLHTRRWQKIA
jgi:glycerophosphoryl diester phosphodiesterase